MSGFYDTEPIPDTSAICILETYSNLSSAVVWVVENKTAMSYQLPQFPLKYSNESSLSNSASLCRFCKQNGSTTVVRIGSASDELPDEIPVGTSSNTPQIKYTIRFCIDCVEAINSTVETLVNRNKSQLVVDNI